LPKFQIGQPPFSINAGNKSGDENRRSCRFFPFVPVPEKTGSLAIKEKGISEIK